MTLALGFLIAGFTLLRTLRLFYTDFYQDYKFYLIATTIFLTLPLLFRAVLDFMNINDTWDNYWDMTNARLSAYNVIFFIMTTYLPILGQVGSLVFGVVRYKQV